MFLKVILESATNLDLGALARSKFQICGRFWYIFLLLILFTGCNRPSSSIVDLMLAGNEEQDLEQEVVYRVLLKPLWDIWHPLFKEEKKLNQLLFFRQVLQEHRACLYSRL